MRLVDETLRSIVVKRPAPNALRQHLCLDKGYDYEAVRKTVDALGYISHLRRRGEKPRKRRARSRARRWVVERTHSWMNRFRRLLVRWEKKVQNYLGFLHLACAYICLKAAGVLG
jgi:putative transposase